MSFTTLFFLSSLPLPSNPFPFLPIPFKILTRCPSLSPPFPYLLLSYSFLPPHLTLLSFPLLPSSTLSFLPFHSPWLTLPSVPLNTPYPLFLSFFPSSFPLLYTPVRSSNTHYRFTHLFLFPHSSFTLLLTPLRSSNLHLPSPLIKVCTIHLSFTPHSPRSIPFSLSTLLASHPFPWTSLIPTPIPSPPLSSHQLLFVSSRGSREAYVILS